LLYKYKKAAFAEISCNTDGSSFYVNSSKYHNFYVTYLKVLNTCWYS